MSTQIVLNKGAEITINKQKFDLLKKAYSNALSFQKPEFVFFGHIIETGYAKYLVEYLSPQFNFK